MNDTLVRVDGLSKKFCLSLRRSLWYGLRDLGSELAGRPHGGGGGLRPEEFWALRDIGFELRRGECLGLIGHNGAGKTTLLRVLNGLLKPDAGRAELRGRVGAMIALGAGFNPVLTGRENIYIYASVLGMGKREVDTRLEEIVEFAEIGQFIDTPLRNYSSGMGVRLGFSIAVILLKPDILLLDEVLAVGDVGFVVKCLNAMRRLAEDAAVIFVSHNMTHVATFCTRVAVMNRGRLEIDTPHVAAGIDRYFTLAAQQPIEIAGTGQAKVLGLELHADDGTQSGAEIVLEHGASASVSLRFSIDPSVDGAHVVLNLLDEARATILSLPVHGEDGRLLRLPPGEHGLRIALGQMDLNKGRYHLVVVIRGAGTSMTLARVHGLGALRVQADGDYWGKVVRPVSPTAALAEPPGAGWR